jgi:GT2 family glycosyltransferase
MNVSVVIVNWNTGMLLAECVRSVLANGADEVIVVDNASSDDSIAGVRAQFASVKVVENRENAGFARASNQAVRLSRGRYILLLNPDTRMVEGSLDRMVRFLESRPKAGAVGPRLLNTDGTLQVSAYPEPTLFREMWRLLHLDSVWPAGSYPMSSWPEDEAREVDVLTGACILLRREVLDAGDLLDERYFIYSEDQDLCRRLRSQGWDLYWEPDAVVVHHGGQSTRQVKLEMFVQLYREKVSYFRKHHGRAATTMYKLVLLLASLTRQLAAPEIARSYRRLVRELPGL